MPRKFWTLMLPMRELDGCPVCSGDATQMVASAYIGFHPVPLLSGGCVSEVTTHVVGARSQRAQDIALQSEWHLCLATCSVAAFSHNRMVLSLASHVSGAFATSWVRFAALAVSVSIQQFSDVPNRTGDTQGATYAPRPCPLQCYGSSSHQQRSFDDFTRARRFRGFVHSSV